MSDSIVIIPTYNEKENIENIIRVVFGLEKEFHILIIDDDVHINDMLDNILTQAGYKVYHAYSGTEALLFLSNCKPDLILLDLMLPGLSGEEVLSQIVNIPVIVMSAKADVKDKVALLLNGAADYITKPFEIDELLARIIVQLRDLSLIHISEPTRPY